MYIVVSMILSQLGNIFNLIYSTKICNICNIFNRDLEKINDYRNKYAVKEMHDSRSITRRLTPFSM